MHSLISRSPGSNAKRLFGMSVNENPRGQPRFAGPSRANTLAGMSLAFVMAHRVAEAGNVPVGAVVMVADQVVARAGNLRESLQDPTAHAEILALRDASQRLGRWRLEDATVFVTLEPCAMCASALVQARVKKVVYAATEPKTGAHQSVLRLFEGTATEVVQDASAAPESAEMLARFFQDLRQREREARNRQ